MNRYFIISIAHEGGYGTVPVTTKGKYINQSEFLESVKSYHNLIKVSIINIIELKEAEYKEFFRES